MFKVDGSVRIISIGLLVLVSLSIVSARDEFNDFYTQIQNELANNSLTESPFSQGRDSNNGLLVVVLREFFTDINWKTIAEAREQVEKFIQKVEKLIRIIRGKEGSPQLAVDNRMFAGRWWKSSSKGSSGSDAAQATKVKEMLEKVACFVGYMRLLNYSNEALAELDESKLVTNLFLGKKNSSSWFG